MSSLNLKNIRASLCDASNDQRKKNHNVKENKMVTPEENILDPIDLPVDTPILNIGTRKGCTGYIDFITCEEVRHGLMRGLDLFDRPFVVIKFLITKSDGSRHVRMQTFFQRYSKNKLIWQSGGHATTLLLETVGGVTPAQFEFLNRLVSGDSCILGKKHQPWDEGCLGATITIQNH